MKRDLPDQVGNVLGGAEFGVAVDEENVAGGFVLVPTGRIRGIDDMAIGEEDGTRGFLHAGGRQAIEAADQRRVTDTIEHVGIADPLEQSIGGAGVSAAFIGWAGDGGLFQTVIIERAIDAVEDACLPIVSIAVAATSPDEHFHAVDGDVVVGPKKALIEFRQIEVHGDAALLELGEALGGAGLGFGSGKRRQEKSSKNGDDCNDNEEFDESESVGGDVSATGQQVLEFLISHTDSDSPQNGGAVWNRVRLGTSKKVPKNGRSMGRFIQGFRGREWRNGSHRQLAAVNGMTKNIFCDDAGRFEEERNGLPVVSTKNVEGLPKGAGLEVLPERNSDIIIQTS
jgi:hypothetical protein